MDLSRRSAKHDIAAAKKENYSVRQDSTRLRQIGVHFQRIDRKQHSREITQVSQNENCEESREGWKHRTAVPKCPSAIENEAESQSDRVAAGVRDHIVKTEQQFT